MKIDEIKPHCHQLRKNPLPPIKWLRKRYRYDPITGKIHNRGDLFGHQHEAIIRGYKNLVLPKKNNKPQINIRSHVLAFALINGKWPHLIDHIDGDISNNKWKNLNNVSASRNRINSIRLKNRKPMKNNSAWALSRNGKRFHFTKFCDAQNFNQRVKDWYQDGMQGTPPEPIRTESFYNCKSRRNALKGQGWKVK